MLGNILYLRKMLPVLLGAICSVAGAELPTREARPADQPGEWDSATTLHRELSTSLRNRAGASAHNADARTPAKPREGGEALPHGGPVTAATAATAARIARRSAPAADSKSSGRPAYTPDFSRQKLSFAQVVKHDRIDLPRYNDVVAAQNLQIAQSEEGQAWSLVEIVDTGLTFSPVLRRSVAQYDNAVARRKQARADLLPVFSTSLKGGYAAVKTDGLAEKTSNDYRTSLTRLTQPVYNQTNFYNLSGSRASEQSADYRMDAAREMVVMSLVQATVNLASARVVIGFADEQESQLNDVFRYLEARAQAGASSNAELERARTRVLAARQTRIELQANYKSALYEMERLLGEVPKAIWLPYLNQLPSLPQTKDELHRLMNEYNTELKAYKEDIVAQEAAISAEQGKLLPSLALSAEHDMQRNTSGFTPKQTDKRIVLTMNWAFSLGGKEVYGAQEAKAELRNREARYQEELRRLEQSLEADFALLQSATQRITTGESEQRSAEAVVAAVREQLQLGRIGSLLDALDAFDRLFAARNRQVQALSQQIIAQAHLLRLIGMLSQLATVSPQTTQSILVKDAPSDKTIFNMNGS